MAQAQLTETVDGSAGLHLGGSRVLFGTTSWADRSLAQAGTFYPRRTMTAQARLAFYASRFPLAEIATTYRFPPTPDLCAQWAERTPDGFVFDVRAWSLLSGAPTLPDSLWPDLQASVDARHRDRRRLYAHHLPEDALEECWDRFAHALRPLRDSGRLGVVIFQYPGWFTPRPETWAELALLRHRMEGYRVAVELRSPKWMAGDDCEPALEWLEEHSLAFVSVDGPEDGRGLAAPWRRPPPTCRSCGSSVAARWRANPGLLPIVTAVTSWRDGSSAYGPSPGPPRRFTSSWITAGARTRWTTPRSCSISWRLARLVGTDLDDRPVVAGHPPLFAVPGEDVDRRHGHPALIP